MAVLDADDGGRWSFIFLQSGALQSLGFLPGFGLKLFEQ
jgi:hypothetical protein